MWPSHDCFGFLVFVGFFFPSTFLKYLHYLIHKKYCSEVEELRLEDEIATKTLKICDPLYETTEVMNINVLLNF